MQLTEPLDIEYSGMPQLLNQSHSLPWNYCQPVTENSTHTQALNISAQYGTPIIQQETILCPILLLLFHLYCLMNHLVY